MEKSPEYDRIRAMLEAKEMPADELQEWINKYLELADKASGIKTAIPFRPRPSLKKVA